MAFEDLTAERVYKDALCGFGDDLCALLAGDGWTDVMVNPDGRVFVDAERMREVPCRTDAKGLANAALTLAAWSGQELNERRQRLDVVVPVALWRASFVVPPAVPRISADFRRPSKRVLRPDELVGLGTVTAAQLGYLKESVARRRNIVMAGGTGSGKTTLVNSLMTLAAPDDRMLVIEDAAELVVPQRNNVHIVVNGSYSYQDAIAGALRFRPTRIVIGECRSGVQTLEMLKAWNTGHPGGFTTIHANSAENVLDRMDQLCAEVSVSSQRRAIEEALDVVCFLARTRDNRRVVAEMLDVKARRLV